MVALLSNFEDVHSLAKDIEGWCSDNEAKLLYNCACSLTGSGAIVEIGSWCSKSLTYISMGALSSGFKNKIFSIDPFLTSKDEPNGKYETFIANLKKNDLYDKVIHIKEKSQIAGKSFDEKIEFIFIDGFHKYEAVKADFELFFDKVTDGGYVALHDVLSYKGPTDLVFEMAQRSDFRLVDAADGVVIGQKVSKLTESNKETTKRILDSISFIISGMEKELAD